MFGDARPRRQRGPGRAAAACRRRGSSPPARSGRSAGAASCTGSRRRSRCSRAGRPRTLDCPPVPRSPAPSARRQHRAAHRRHRRHRQRDRPRARGARSPAAAERAPRGRVLEPLAEELGRRARSLPTCGRAADVDRLAEAALDAEVDVLVANAAHPGHRRADRADARSRSTGMLDVNLRAPIALARALAPAMVARGARPLVFISSLSGKSAPAGLVAVLGHEVRSARLRAGAARGPARHGRRRLGGRPRASSATRGCSPTPASSCRRGVGTTLAAGRRRRGHPAIEHNRAEVDVAPLGAARRRGVRAAGARGSPARGQQPARRRTRIADRDGRGPAPPALSARSARPQRSARQRTRRRAGRLASCSPVDRGQRQP